MGKRERYLYIDNLRLTMIILVVMVHLAVTYSRIGSWYYFEPAKLSTMSLIVFAFFQSFTQAYFMGFLFLIAGYFIPHAYDRKGFRSFIKGRLFRLGIPTLLYMVTVHPFTVHIKFPETRFEYLQNYSEYITTFSFIRGSGPLWFALALLVFSIIYAIVRVIKDRAKGGEIKREVNKVPSTKSILVLIAIISVGTFLVRLVQPIDTSILNMQLCFFTQYIVLFIVGIKAYRNNWFNEIEYSVGIKWLKAATFIGLILWVIVLIGGGGLTMGFDIFKGGLYWQSFAYAIWESFIGVAMSIGLIALFREKLNYQNKFIKILSDSTFAVYMFHAPIIVFITSKLSFLSMNPLIKFMMMSLICIPICFLVTHYILRKVPLLNRIL